MGDYADDEIFRGLDSGESWGLRRMGRRYRPSPAGPGTPLAKARILAHAAFDPLWQKGTMSRSQAYQWLAHQLGLNLHKCHIGYFGIEMCQKVASICLQRQFQQLTGTPMNHCMTDLETWGLRAGSAPRSIGACMFDPQTGQIGATFYVNIDRQSCLDIGLHVEPGTEQFWRDQSPAAQKALEPGQRHIAEAFTMYLDWWDTQKARYQWGHGADFDPVHLRAIADALMIEVPWKFWDVRCSRTTLALNNRTPDRRGGIKHYALDDAKAQAKAVAAACRAMKVTLP